jgi:hypothetical protein
MAVAPGEFDEKIVRVLAVDQGLAVCRFPSLKEQRIAAFAHQRVRRHHAAQAERAFAQRALRHRHQHAGAEGLRLAPRPALIVVDQIDEAVRHDRPVAEPGVYALMR